LPPHDVHANGIIIPSAFQQIDRRPSEVLISWPVTHKDGSDIFRNEINGLTWLSADVIRAPTSVAYSKNGKLDATRPDNALVRFRFGSLVWSMHMINDDTKLTARAHRIYARVCLYFALRRLLGTDPIPFIAASSPTLPPPA
jgi:hypothetical protein